MPDNQAQPTFDRVLGCIDGMPDVQSTKPSTVMSVLPFVGAVVTYVVQTYRTKDQGFMVFLQTVDAEGRARFLIPDKVAQAIYRQRQSLTDRSTPASRARQQRKRERERRRVAKEARRQRLAETGG